MDQPISHHITFRRTPSMFTHILDTDTVDTASFRLHFVTAHGGAGGTSVANRRITASIVLCQQRGCYASTQRTISFKAKLW